MELLDLPLELLQLILKHCSTPSLLQASLTCHALFTIASTCREVVIHHLSLTPGLPAGALESSTPPTEELFCLLRKRAAQHLYGADLHVDSVTYALRNGSIDARACAFRARGNPNLALVERENGVVRLYHAVPGEVEPVCTLEQPLKGKFEVLRVVMTENTVSVLQRPLPETSDNLDSLHPYVKDAAKPFYDRGAHLVHYHRKAADRPFSYVTLATLEGFDEWEPVAVDVAERPDEKAPHMVAMSWQHRVDNRILAVVHSTPAPLPSDKHKLTTMAYTHYKPVLDTNPPGPRHPGAVSSPHQNICKLRFNDRYSQLLYYRPSTLIYPFFQLLWGDPAVEATRFRCSLPHANRGFVEYTEGEDKEDHLRFTIDIPFYCTHETEPPTATQPSMCHWQYLSFATGNESGRHIGAILRTGARCRSLSCGHMPNLDRGRRLDNWTLVARLIDFSMNDTSLVGTVTASSGGTRLAVATWKTIRVWALQPAELIASNSHHFYSPQLEFREGVVDLSPIVLDSDAVVFSISFVPGTEDELVCITDKGIMTWDVGPMTKGKRDFCTLLDTVPAVDNFPESESESELEGSVISDMVVEPADSDDEDDEDDEEDEDEEVEVEDGKDDEDEDGGEDDEDEGDEEDD